MDYIPPPDPVTWELAPPLTFGAATYTSVTLRAPTAADVLKATAIQGASGTDVALRLIAAVNAEGVPYEALRALPMWQIEQMSSYLDAFGGAPLPGPLEEWRKARAASAAA